MTVKNTFTRLEPQRGGTKTAGTSFEVTVATYPGYSRPDDDTVGGLSTSPNTKPPTIRDQATFIGGSPRSA